MTDSNTPPDMRAAAMDLVDRGFAVIPIQPADKRPYVKWSELNHVGHDKVLAWWRLWPEANIAILTGHRSGGLLVLDVDPRNGGTHVGLPPTRFTITTGGGGKHLYYRAPQGAEKLPKQASPGLDVKFEGGYVIAPPSLHSSGRRYEWDAAIPRVDDLRECPIQAVVNGEAMLERSVRDCGRTPCMAR
jgi:hypothetical protein